MSPELNALVEKVARAIWTARPAPYPYENVGTDELLDLHEEARAAIRAVAEATREPSEAMLERGTDDHDTPSTPLYTSEAAIIWRAMHAATPLGEALRDE